MPFNEQLPEWNAVGVEPPASKKNTGWQAGEKPPADYWNWQMNRTYRALRELQEKALHKDDVTASDIPTANGSDIQSEIENLKSSVSDGKAAVAGAITDMGVPTSPSDTFQQMAENIRAIQTGPDTGDATAVAGDILSGKTAYARGEKLIGTMPNRGAITITPGPSDQSIPAGYHNGNGKVAGVVFDPSKVLEGTTIAGTAGTMPNRGNVSVTLTQQGQEYTVPAGYHAGAGKVKAQFANLIPENIREGVNIGGVIGTMPEGAKYAYGSVVGQSNGEVKVTGLAFRPRTIIIVANLGIIIGMFYAEANPFMKLLNSKYMPSQGLVQNLTAPITPTTDGFTLAEPSFAGWTFSYLCFDQTPEVIT